MERTAVFTITREERTTGWYYSLKSNAYNRYNVIGIHQHSLWETMEKLTDTFNNVLGIAILFEMG